jgi:hypothetical protein
MGFTQAFVICFIAYLIYKVIKPSGLPKTYVDKLIADITKTIAVKFKESNLKNKATVALNYDDLRSGDPARVEQAIARIEEVFDSEIVDCDEVLAKYKDKPETTVSNCQNKELKD